MAKFSGLGGRLYRGETSLNIIEARKKWYLLSAFFILISMASLGIKGLALGIEFKGGSSFSVTSQNRSIESARAAVAEAGYVGEPIVQTVGSEKIKIQTGVLDAAQSNAIQDSLAKKFGVTVESIDVQNIGPSWGEEISKKALQGLIAFLIIIFYFTKPLVSLLAKVKFFQSGSTFSGLSPKSIGMQNAVTAGEA